MQRLLTALGALGSGLLLAVACTDDKTGNLFPDPDAGALGGRPGAGGSGGSRAGAGGAGGSAGMGGTAAGSAGSAGTGDMLGGSGGQDAGTPPPGCQSALDCDDQNACTLESCEGGVCVPAGFALSGAACGSATNDACTAPDTCDGAGVCQPNHTGAVGAPCGSNTNDECTAPDTCDAQGICQPHNAVLGAPCGSASVDECTLADQCDDNGRCSPNNVAAGTLCGNATDDECANHDVCGNGVCLPNDEPNGTACTNGSCTQGQCVSGQPVGCPVDVASSVPFNTTWSSVGRPNLYGGGCDSDGTPQYALVFTAPQAGTFRFTGHALVDSTPYTGADPSANPTQPPDGDAVLTVANGSCAGQAAPFLGCNDDVTPGVNIDSQLDVTLTDQQQVTVYLNERTQTGGGTGTLSITLLP